MLSQSPGNDLTAARPARRRWELPAAGDAFPPFAFGGDDTQKPYPADGESGPLVAAPDSTGAAGGRRNDTGGQKTHAAEEEGVCGGWRACAAQGTGPRDVQGGCEAWAPLAEVVEACVLAGVRAQYACSSGACLG